MTLINRQRVRPTVPVAISVPVPVPVAIPVPVPISVSVPVPISVLIPVSVAFLLFLLVSVSVSAPLPVPILVPVLVSVPVFVTLSFVRLQQEADGLAFLACACGLGLDRGRLRAALVRDGGVSPVRLTVVVVVRGPMVRMVVVVGEGRGGFGGRRQRRGVAPGSEARRRAQLGLSAVFVLLRRAAARRLLGARQRHGGAGGSGRGAAGLSRHARRLRAHFGGRRSLALYADPAGSRRWLREGQQRWAVLQEVGERGGDLCVGLHLRLTALREVRCGGARRVRTCGEDLGDGGGGRGGGQRGRVRDGDGRLWLGVGGRGGGGARQGGGAAGGGGRGVVVFRVSGFVVFRGRMPVGLPVLVHRVLHLLVDGLALVRVGVGRGGHGRDRVGRGCLAVSGEHLAHHLYVDRLVFAVSRLDLRVRCLERQG